MERLALGLHVLCKPWAHAPKLSTQITTRLFATFFEHLSQKGSPSVRLLQVFNDMVAMFMPSPHSVTHLSAAPSAQRIWCQRHGLRPTLTMERICLTLLSEASPAPLGCLRPYPQVRASTPDCRLAPRATTFITRSLILASKDVVAVIDPASFFLTRIDMTAAPT